MQRTELMQQLWKKAEETKDFRTRKLLQAAGNLVEATFTSDDLPKAIGHAVKDSGSLVSLEDETNFLLAMGMLVVEE